MKDTFIKSVTEKKVKVSENKFQNQIKIKFETPEQSKQNDNTITLVGDGSIKVLMPV